MSCLPPRELVPGINRHLHAVERDGGLVRWIQVEESVRNFRFFFFFVLSNLYSNHRIIFNKKLMRFTNLVTGLVFQKLYLERELQYSHELSNISSL